MFVSNARIASLKHCVHFKSFITRSNNYSLIKRFIKLIDNTMNSSIKRKTSTQSSDVIIDDQSDANTDTNDDKPIQKQTNKKSKVILPEECFEDSDYYLENGLRKVYPYYYTYGSYCKGRWIGHTFNEFYCNEFRAMTTDRLQSRLSGGHLLVNNKPVDENYKLKSHDFITHKLHRHEFPVLAAPIPIIHMCDQLLVVDKPPSVPVHPCGRYRHNSLLRILRREHNQKNLHSVHRLDRLTSGIVLLPRTDAMAEKLHKQFANNTVAKEYLCRVDGNFPDEAVICDQPLEVLSYRIGISIVSPNGKQCKTIFKKQSFNGKSSVVLCAPKSGRMHQIRVHLQYLGHPILNDSFYNNQVFGEDRGKNGNYGKTKQKLLQDLDEDHNRIKLINKTINNSPDLESRVIALKALNHYTNSEKWISSQTKYKFDREKMKKDDECDECGLFCVDPEPKDLLIYLHALRYKGSDWSYETEIPIWARDDWLE